MLLSDKGGSDFEMPEPGSYGATCRQLIDLGTQEGDYQGQKTIRRQVMVGWELDELMSDGRPFVVSKFYTASLSPKSTLRHDMAAWRGRDFTPEELQGFEAKNLLNKSCLVSLVKTENGKVKVTSVSKLPKGMVTPPLVNPVVYFSLDPTTYDQTVFDALSNGIKKIIMQSPEWVARNAEAHQVVGQSGSIADANKALDDLESDIPF